MKKHNQVKTDEIENSKVNALLDGIQDVERLEFVYELAKQNAEMNMQDREADLSRHKKNAFVEGGFSVVFAGLAAFEAFATAGATALMAGGFMGAASVSAAVDAKKDYKKVKESKTAIKDSQKFIERLDKAYAERKEAILNPPPPPPPAALFKLTGAGNSFDQSAQKPVTEGAEQKAAQQSKPNPPTL